MRKTKKGMTSWGSVDDNFSEAPSKSKSAHRPLINQLKQALTLDHGGMVLRAIDKGLKGGVPPGKLFRTLFRKYTNDFNCSWGDYWTEIIHHLADAHINPDQKISSSNPTTFFHILARDAPFLVQEYVEKLCPKIGLKDRRDLDVLDTFILMTHEWILVDGWFENFRALVDYGFASHTKESRRRINRTVNQLKKNLLKKRQYNEDIERVLIRATKYIYSMEEKNRSICDEASMILASVLVDSTVDDVDSKADSSWDVIEEILKFSYSEPVVEWFRNERHPRSLSVASAPEAPVFHRLPRSPHPKSTHQYYDRLPKDSFSTTSGSSDSGNQNCVHFSQQPGRMPKY